MENNFEYNNLEFFIEMLKVAEQQHDAHEYLMDDNKMYTDVIVYSAKGLEGPGSKWKFDEAGQLVKVTHRKRAFIHD